MRKITSIKIHHAKRIDTSSNKSLFDSSKVGIVNSYELLGNGSKSELHKKNKNKHS